MTRKRKKCGLIQTRTREWSEQEVEVPTLTKRGRSGERGGGGARMPSLLAYLCPLVCSRRVSSLMTITAKHLDGRRHKDRR